jgi:hypothetical protein
MRTREVANIARNIRERTIARVFIIYQILSGRVMAIIMPIH